MFLNYWSIIYNLCANLALLLRHNPSEVSTESSMHAKIIFTLDGENANDYPDLWIWVSIAPKLICDPSCQILPYVYTDSYWIFIVIFNHSKSISKQYIYGALLLLWKFLFLMLQSRNFPRRKIGVNMLLTSFVSLFQRSQCCASFYSMCEKNNFIFSTYFLEVCTRKISLETVIPLWLKLGIPPLLPFGWWWSW